MTFVHNFSYNYNLVNDIYSIKKLINFIKLING